MTEPMPPPVPMRPMMARITSLAVAPAGSSPLTVTAIVPGRCLGERLGGEHVLDLAGADAEGQRAEGAVGGGVAVAADDRHARQRAALLGADHVDDALVRVAHAVVRDAELGGVGGEHLELLGRDRVGDRLVDVLGGHVVVGGGHGEVGAADAAAGQPDAVEGLGAGDLVDEVEVDVEQVGLAGCAAHHVAVPHLLGERLGHAPVSPVSGRIGQAAQRCAAARRSSSQVAPGWAEPRAPKRGDLGSGPVVAEGRVALLQRRREALRAHALDELLEARLLGAEGAQLRAGADGVAEAHVVHGAVHGALVELHDVGRQQGDPLRHRQHLAVEVGLGERAVGPAEPHGLDARDRVARDHHLHGRPHPEEPGVELHVGHAEAHRGVAHLGVLGHVDEVATGGQLAAAGQAVAVHLRDHRLGQVPDPHPRLGDVAGPVPLPGCGEVRHLEALVPAAQVVAGREAGAGASHDRHPHLVVEVVGLERVDEVAAQRVVERVALLGAVEGDAPDVRRGVVDDDEGVGHLIAFGSMSRGEALERLVRDLVDRRRDLVDRRAVLRGERRERRQVEVVELRRVAGEQVAQLGLGHVVEQRAQVLAGVRARCPRRAGSRCPT